MPEYICTGSVTLHGVMFFIEADDATQARIKAEQGQYERYETDGAEAVNWELSATVRENN